MLQTDMLVSFWIQKFLIAFVYFSLFALHSCLHWFILASFYFSIPLCFIISFFFYLFLSFSLSVSIFTSFILFTSSSTILVTLLLFTLSVLSSCFHSCFLLSFIAFLLSYFIFFTCYFLSFFLSFFLPFIYFFVRPFFICLLAILPLLLLLLSAAFFLLLFLFALFLLIIFSLILPLTPSFLFFLSSFSLPALLPSSLPPPLCVACLRVSPDRSQFFRYNSISLSCEDQLKSTGWKVKRNTSGGGVRACSSGWGSISSGSTCIIRNIYPPDSGVYWCESEDGERSNGVNITITGTAYNTGKKWWCFMFCCLDLNVKLQKYG